MNQGKNIERLAVVGAVAAGMSAASQAKRRNPDLEVVVFERGPHVSYGACGMPYNIQDPDRAIDDLVVISAERFRSERGIDVRTGHEVTEIDPGAGRLRFKRSQGEGEFAFDALVLATGCRAVTPNWPGKDLPGIFALHTLEQATSIKRYLQDRSLRRAVVVGGGHIGLEMADVLTSRGLAVTLIKRSSDLPSGYPEVISQLVHSELERFGVEVMIGAEILGFEGGVRVEQVKTSAGPIQADVVILATGVKP